MQQIPKKVHLSWKSKDLLASNAPLISSGVCRLVELNTDWDVVISDDQDVDDYLRKMLEPSEYKMVQHIGVVPQTDIWRLIKMYFEGGLYVDIDRFWNLKLSDLVEENTKQVLPTNKDMDFSHDFMLAAPGSPVYAAAIDLYFKRRKEGHQNIYLLGPQTYMHAVTYATLGEMFDSNPGEGLFKDIREAVGSYEFMKTFREDGPYNTVCYQDGQNGIRADGIKTIDWEMQKRSFYASQGIKHWTGAW